MTYVAEVHEKVLEYLKVMSRPVNMNAIDDLKNQKFQVTPIWSPLYVDLADRRITNWQWEKYEGNRQREKFLELIETLDFENKTRYFTNNHDYEQYKNIKKYSFLTTISMPVIDRRPNAVSLIISIFNSNI